MAQAIRKLIAGFMVILGLQGNAFAASMSDLWSNPSEQGWGINIIEQQGTLFVTLFVYGPDGRPTWYVGSEVVRIASSSGRVFNGTLYQTSGPWFGGFFNTSSVGIRPVGTITIAATTPVRATVTYSVDGITTSKQIQRQTWRHINLGGTYYGAMDVLNSTNCTNLSTSPMFVSQTITATFSGANGNLTMIIADPTGSFTFSGSYTQYGSIYDARGTLSFQGMPLIAVIQDFTADDDGIRGNLVVQAADGCIANFRFSAVRPG